MKKNVIINVPMTIMPQKTRYDSDDRSLPVSDRATGFPVMSFLERTLAKEDEVKMILLAKRSPYSKWEQRVNEIREEIAEINANIGAEITFTVLDSEFDQAKYVHEKLMERIVACLDGQAHVIADITYGPKDLPIVVFAALGFAEKFLECEIDHILYGMGVFNDEGQIVSTKICDMSPLYSLSSLTNTLNCDDPEKARKMLKSIVSL